MDEDNDCVHDLLFYVLIRYLGLGVLEWVFQRKDLAWKQKQCHGEISSGRGNSSGAFAFVGKNRFGVELHAFHGGIACGAPP